MNEWISKLFSSSSSNANTRWKSAENACLKAAVAALSL